MRAAILALALIVTATLAALPASRAHAQEASADAVKAAFVFNFAKLVAWPAGRFEKEDSPLHVCLLPDDPMKSALSSALEGKLVGDRPVVVESAASDELKQCHVVFLGSTLERQYAEAMARARGAGVLIIDEGRAFAWPNGMIRLFTEDGRIRFELNVAAVEQAGLKVDPRMIRLARIATPPS